MMQKRTLYSLLLISFIVVFGFSFAMANDVTIQTKNVARCSNGQVNVTANVTSDSVSAVEVVVVVAKSAGCGQLDSLKVNWDAGFTQLPDRIIDYTKVNGTDPDTIRFSALRINPGGQVLAKGSKVIAQLTFKTTSCCGGAVTIAGGEFTYSNPTSPIVTQFVDAATQLIVPASLVAGTVTIVNAAPVLDAIADATLHWGAIYTGVAHAKDNDSALSCESKSYSLLAGPGTMSVNSATGAIFWATASTDVCDHLISIVATDGCAAADTVTFTIHVTNTAPVFTLCPGTQVMVNGDVVTALVHANDSDNLAHPNALVYSKLSGPSWAAVAPSNGTVTLSPTPATATPGLYQVCVLVSDGSPVCTVSPSNADTCCFTVEVRSLGIEIVKQHGPGGLGVMWGAQTTVDVVKLPGSNYPIGGYDFLIQYDNSVLTFLTAVQGTDLTTCHWEYFTYRTSAFGNCGSGCPSGMVRLVALAETNNGSAHPSCYLSDGSSTAYLAQLKFLVVNNENYQCQFVPVRFIWLDCGDNTLSNKRGDSLMISKHVYDWVTDGLGNYTEIDSLNNDTLPNIYGAPTYCLDSLPGTKGIPLAVVDFYNGGVDIICAKDVDDRGDINLNGVTYEIADAVMFTNYFIAGLTAFSPHIAGSTTASDVNADGITLSVADLVYLIRVVIGDAAPYPKDAVNTEKVQATRTYDNGVLGVGAETRLAAAFVIAKGNVTPTLKGEATKLTLNYSFDKDANQTRILVAPGISDAGVTLGGGFTGDFLDLGTNAEVVSVDGSSMTGERVAFTVIPKHFALDQNYPNPFNPTTTISFALPRTSSWTLNVYNVRGQLVKSYAGTDEAGTVTRTFDGANYASGMYFYKLTAGEYTSVKKMVMIK